ncbi:hypothetical protein [Eudoraea adriatica]|uniref:hypothetical protein n=1 Tax=Eudoraea adriatica TaxID=446681 RepID=UPI0003730C0B|nr:hypothetical protein [Eudoraea adriatica]
MPLFNWEKVDRNNPHYKTCVKATTAAGAVAGMATGSVIPVAGTAAGFLGGAFWGFVGGYLACPYLVPAIKKKIEQDIPLTNYEIKSATEAMGSYAGLSSAPDAIKLLALVKSSKKSGTISSMCSNPNYIAKQILKQA